jgi:hypothetical protein
VSVNNPNPIFLNSRPSADPLGASAACTEIKSAQPRSIAEPPDQPNKPSQAGLKIEGLTSIRLGDAELLYADAWLSDADQWFERLKKEVPLSPETIKMYGKPLVLRRETCNYGEDYDYNINAKPAIEWAGAVLELKKMLEDATGRVFTQCACNLYPDGETGIGLHHDKRHPLLVAVDQLRSHAHNGLRSEGRQTRQVPADGSARVRQPAPLL